MSKIRDHWPNEKISLLIDLYRSNECLWNTGIKDYKNKSKRNTVLELICNQLGITKNELVRKIHNLRNQFNGEMKKVQKRNSELQQNTKSRWEHYSKLMFLEEIITPRPGFNPFYDSNASIKEKISISEYTEEHNSNNDDPIQIEEIPPEYTEELLSSNHDIDQGQDLLSSNNENTETDNICSQPKRSRTDEDEQIHENYATQEEILQYEEAETRNNVTTNSNFDMLDCSEQKHQKQAVLVSRDEWDVFGEFVAAELRNLNSDISKKKLKRRIMQSILEISNEDDGININIKLA